MDARTLAAIQQRRSELALAEANPAIGRTVDPARLDRLMDDLGAHGWQRDLMRRVLAHDGPVTFELPRRRQRPPEIDQRLAAVLAAVLAPRSIPEENQ